MIVVTYPCQRESCHSSSLYGDDIIEAIQEEVLPTCTCDYCDGIWRLNKEDDAGIGTL